MIIGMNEHVKIAPGQALMDPAATIPVVRVVCRYPFDAAQAAPRWVVEHINQPGRVVEIVEESYLTGRQLLFQAPVVAALDGSENHGSSDVLTAQNVAHAIATAARQLVNAPLPLVLLRGVYEVSADREHPWWVAKRNLRASLDTYKYLTGVDGDQDPREEESDEG
jgi:hypothetical protein